MESDNLAAICRARQGDESMAHPFQTPPAEDANTLRMGVFFEWGLGIVALFLAWVFGIDLLQQLAGDYRFAAAAIARGVLATLPMLAVYFLLARSRWPPLRRLRRQVQQLVRHLVSRANIIDIAALSLFAGVGEELLFRGVIQTLAIRWTTPTTGLILASLLFGAAHSISRTYFVLATLVGFYLGWLAHQFGELITPITVHALYDFCVLWWISRGWRENGSSGSTG